jgi:hypothetical protein
MKVSGKHEAEIVIAERNVYLGRFDTPEEASAAYLEARLNLAGYGPPPG